jgi:hypothetical protein
MINSTVNYSSATITRPDNTTAYAAYDMVGQKAVVEANAGTAVLEFLNVGEGAIVLDEVNLRIDLNAVPANMAGFVLHLFSTAPATSLLDNGAFNLAAADRDLYLGAVAIGTPVDIGDTLYISATPAKRIILTGGKLYGVLVTVGNYTPASKTVAVVSLVAHQGAVA